jgi:hypothetical protein
LCFVPLFCFTNLRYFTCILSIYGSNCTKVHLRVAERWYVVLHEATLWYEQREIRR